MKPGRIVRSRDFERVLRTAPRVRSAHFALHHLSAAPQPAARRLSTGRVPANARTVDDSPAAGPSGAPGGVWIGAVIPKRHARRAVTRNLIRRAIREAALAQADALRAGLCVVRLRAPVSIGEFPSAASETLRRLVRAELAELLGRAGDR